MTEKMLIDQKDRLEERLKRLEPFAFRSSKKYLQFKQEYHELKKELNQVEQQISFKIRKKEKTTVTNEQNLIQQQKKKWKKISIDLLKEKKRENGSTTFKKSSIRSSLDKTPRQPMKLLDKAISSKPLRKKEFVQRATIPAQSELEKLVRAYDLQKKGPRSKHEWGEPEIQWKTFVDNDRFKFESTLPTRYSIQVKQQCKQCGAERYNRVYYTSYLSNPSWHWELNKGYARIVYPPVQAHKKMYEDVISRYMELLIKLLAKTDHSFDEVFSSDLPRNLGVYVVCNKTTKEIIYAGRSKNLRRRLLSDHRRGNIDGSQFRKALGRLIGINDEEQISEKIRKNCTFGYLLIDNFEEAVRFEHFITAILSPVLNTKLRQ